MDKPEISFVVPLYNESKVFPLLIQRLNALMDSTTQPIEVVLVDDGSRDNTAQLMHFLALEDDRYQCIFLSRNYGHQLALSAGLSVINATQAVMIIDGDLQDAPELFFDFYQHFLKGYDVVYAVRKKRKEGYIKKVAYHAFYRLLRSISYAEIPLDSGDFSLISKRVVDLLNQMPEESRFIRGMRSWIGFKQIGIEYDRQERAAGDSKYSFKMLFKLAYNGIFNFSKIPIKLITVLGITSILLSLVYFGITLFRKFVYHDVPTGFTALLFVMILFGGVQLVSLGVIGEYVLRIFFQVKNRPLFIIKNRIVGKKLINE
ncbi:dolichol-phosphate mannosyltransferase [Chryseolinea serpens]|uniref:Dolichol-phosphate mannosyltransferase n=1 Tax=Chryseolinea serpens TaxID=947013 RepID=A0A1M5NU19_9BACT|nr:glycosyltransferase family 2 protein [Chryseolinea serpens]SHG93104.1 dolichol-phosphate mannosyltransferase [Chryseolinea serpens]